MVSICIDPGHAAGSDKHGVNGFSEQAHNLQMAKVLKTKLESTGKIKVILTRDNEKDDPSLTTRGRTAAKNGCELFLSMHSNGADGKARGVSVYYSVDLKVDRALAAQLSKAIADALGIPDRGAKTRESSKYPGEDYLTVIDSAQDAGTPHVLLSESGFHDNEADCAIIRTPAGVETIAEAHAKVICSLFGVSYPKPVPVESPAGKYTLYTVKKGDNLWDIAKAQLGSGARYVEIKGLNNLLDDRIYTGQKLKLPTGAAVAEVIHRVAKGENLSRLGKKYGVKWQDIAALNSIKFPWVIHAGQNLKIPKK